MMTTPARILVAVLCVAATNSTLPAYAKSKSNGKGSGACDGDKVKHTVYNLPSESDPKTWGAHKSFRSAVKMQGSGIKTNGNLLSYQGKETKPKPTCKTTTTSASGHCLLSFFSIAADPKHFKMGDVIFVPALVGLKVTMPNGNVIEHPGYFVVHDVGGAIKGAGRFDFFVGKSDYRQNAFTSGMKSHNTYSPSVSKPIDLGDPNKCDLDFVRLGGRDATDAMRMIARLQVDDSTLGGGGNPSPGGEMLMSKETGGGVR